MHGTIGNCGPVCREIDIDRTDECTNRRKNQRVFEPFRGLASGLEARVRRICQANVRTRLLTSGPVINSTGLIVRPPPQEPGLLRVTPQSKSPVHDTVFLCVLFRIHFWFSRSDSPREQQASRGTGGIMFPPTGGTHAHTSEPVEASPGERSGPSARTVVRRFDWFVRFGAHWE
ncbi:hypothetical protein ZHAS_00010621 [Anopheles sinensis]|uniref:Uncharacterized protein n=1 Tax=Anopheles sinensis TaxID=74873 RepID=A0A084VY23_ANOSI|nr:hypothetical protein ZHAS_00010621 [Anopheles sinensis]